MKGKVITDANSLPLPFRTQASTVKPRLTATFFGRLAKTAIHFLVKKTLVNTAKFFGPLVTVLTGFHCTWNPKSTAWNPAFKTVLDSFPDFRMRHSQFNQRWRNTGCYYLPKANSKKWSWVDSCYFVLFLRQSLVVSRAKSGGENNVVNLTQVFKTYSVFKSKVLLLYCITRLTTHESSLKILV